MTQLATQERPLRAAIVGSGPAGFFTAIELLKPGHHVTVDLFEKLAEPYGLIRFGVAPDHQHTRRVTKLFDAATRDPRFTIFPNVEIGATLSVEELRRFYDVIVIATGAEIDRRLDVPGEDLPGCHASLQFAEWANGHPDSAKSVFDLSHETAVIIGNGNVALDCARLLARLPEELRATDIAPAALAVLETSRVRNIIIVGRRGPVQSRFGENELAEIGAFADCGVDVDSSALIIDETSKAELDDPGNDRARLNMESFQRFASERKTSPRKNVIFRFFRQPVRITGNARLEGIDLEETELRGTPWRQSAKGTGEIETIPCGLLIKCVGHKGSAIAGLPFDDTKGVIPTTNGRVTGAAGVYASGWIKRGAKGLIGHNRRDAMETVAAILEDVPTLKPCPEPTTANLQKILAHGTHGNHGR